MKKNSLLWRVSLPGGPPSYLFGTMHVRDLRAFGWVEVAKHYLADCEVFATEFDFSESDPVALSAALALPEGKTLAQHLRPRAWRNLSRYAHKKLGMAADSLLHQHPMSVSTLLLSAHLAEEAPHSVDETLWQHARALGKRTTGVETFADQLETLGKIPFEQHLKNLSWLLKNQSRQRRRLQKMLRHYAAGDIHKLYQSAKKEAKGMRKPLLFKRNARMAERFAEVAMESSLFCAVGAGHLAGGKGMLRLLRKAGFSLSPIALPPVS